MVRLQIPINFRKGKLIMDMFEEFWYISAVVYSKINPFMIHHFGMDKVGFFLRKIKRPRTVNVDGLLFQFEPEVSTCFGRMIGGSFNEGGTHKLLKRVLKYVEKVDLFVDVGSNIGEFVIDVAFSGKVARVIGVEPNPGCVRSCLKSLELNALKNVQLIQKILTDSHEAVRFDMRGENANGHSIFAPPTESEVIYSSTLDDEVQDEYPSAILLIDVEGAEALVLKGGEKFVAVNLPFIIFEYNHISKAHFSLDDIRRILPEGYEIFRLRSEDGFLDRNLQETWNCVAVHENSPFGGVLEEIVK